MADKILKHECAFCGTPTNFVDNEVAYCIDCYAKLRNSAHVHLQPQISPIPNINPLPSPWNNPPTIGNWPNWVPYTIC